MLAVATMLLVADLPLRVAVNLGDLDEGAYTRLGGLALEEQLTLRLLQEGFAVVSPRSSPQIEVNIRFEEQRVVVGIDGAGGRASAGCRLAAVTGRALRTIVRRGAAVLPPQAINNDAAQSKDAKRMRAAFVR